MDRPYPALYYSADATSVSAQTRFLWLSGARLFSLILAALVAAIAGYTWEWVAIFGATFLFAALACELLLLYLKPEKQWYDGRAAAESIKTLAWRYQVNGAPFGAGLSKDEADDKFLDRLKEIVQDLRELDLTPAAGTQITEFMSSRRLRPLKERKIAYQTERIEDQMRWYAQRANWNRHRTTTWRAALVILEVIALLGATLQAAGLFDVDIYGIIATIIAAGVAWLQVKQYQTLARSYSIASHELSAINPRISAMDSEEEWEQFVDQSEAAISREHTLWRASHTI